MEKSGKTYSMISRLPAFYEAGNVESLFFQLLNVFGLGMEQAEMDLFRVMRSHYVETADNEGSQGFGSNQQGDLDKIFSLYLEVLGGTSQLMQINPQFRPGAFQDLPGLLNQLQTAEDSLSQSLVQGFAIANRQRLTQLRSPLTQPQLQEIESILIEEFNRCLQDPQFYQRHQKAFTLSSLTPAKSQLIQKSPVGGRDLEILNRSLLETAYPNQIAKSYAPYRERLLALIRVLRRGAATKEGIRDIVAANLGIFSDDPAAQKAKEKIHVEEYLPEMVSSLFRIHPFSPESPIGAQLTLPQTFLIRNPNVFPTAPGIRIEVKDTRKSTADTPLPSLQPLNNPRLVNSDTQEYFEFKGMLKVNDVLRILPDGQMLLNGVKIPAQSAPPLLPLNDSQWQIAAWVGEAEGRFDQTLFELSRYDQVETDPVPLNRQQAINYEIALTIELTKLTPGAFRVRIPWNIPGFTDKFEELRDHPRSQIPAIIDKVKAAGVLAVIDYEQTWTEHHQMSAQLWVVRSPFAEIHAMEEANFDIGSYQIPYPGGIQHQISDQLLLSGVFDYTQFDSGNHFA